MVCSSLSLPLTPGEHLKLRVLLTLGFEFYALRRNVVQNARQKTREIAANQPAAVNTTSRRRQTFTDGFVCVQEKSALNAQGHSLSTQHAAQAQ